MTNAAIATLGIDLAKYSFQIVGQNAAGVIVTTKKLSKTQLLAMTAKMPRCLIGMEACSGSHHLARELVQQGHDTRLIPAQYVKPFVKVHKNDERDAEAICEAVQRPTMRFVPIKTEDQLDLQALHRVRERLVSGRTSLINQVRSFLLERGITIAKSRRALETVLPKIMANTSAPISSRMRALISGLVDEWGHVDERIDKITDEIGLLAKAEEGAVRLTSIPGVGPITATAVVAAIGNGAAFEKGRDFAAWLGLVPYQHSTGGRQKLLGISKRGNRYLRTLFVHAARSIARFLIGKGTTPLGRWMTALAARVHGNVAIVALANKLARIAWAVLRSVSPFNANHYGKARTAN
jgi:transposase